MAAKTKLLVIQVAGLGAQFAQQHGISCGGRPMRAMATVFPALTCPVQASFRTASLPAMHGVLANGRYDRMLRRTSFWEQSAGLVAGGRIWDGFRQRGRRVAMLFWQQSLGESADIILSPAPIHKHHGGMIDDCYGKPVDLYSRLCRAVGRPFRLSRYWGPMASPASSQWIAEATAALLLLPELAPDLCLTYLPALDYDLQRYGPDHPVAARAAQALRGQLALLEEAAARAGYDVLIFGDYAIASCAAGGAVFPNRALREAGLFATRSVRGRLYPDFHESRAFALCDHEVAQVYVREPCDVPAVRALLAALPGVEQALDAEGRKRRGLQHPEAGEIVLLAAEGQWLAYPWWGCRAEAPDYAAHVDIHSKPGYDPCELFFGWPPGTVSLNPARICGSHGRVDASRGVAWGSTLFRDDVADLLALAGRVANWTENA
ncbi:MAG: alkaline phosphatase family protein [Kiritimatiellia bacterium]